MYKNIKIDQVINSTASLKDLSQTFTILDELNKILHKFLPINLVKHCHIGAIDGDKNLVILYLSDPALGHIINNLANPILANFNNHHFSFAGLLTRIRPQSTSNRPRYKHLDHKVKDKLQQLAISINRTDLIKENKEINEDKEIYF